MRIKNSIKFCYWNIGGVYANNINKLEDNHFLNEIKDFDLVVLAETHVGYNSTFI